MTKPSAVSEGAVFLCPEPPYPLAGGGPMRSASLLHFLADRLAVHLITFRNGASSDPTRFLNPGLAETVTCVSLPHQDKKAFSRMYRNTARLLRGQLPLTDRFGQAEALRQVEAATRNQSYSLAVIEHFWCAPYLDVLRPRARRVVLDLHNIESALHAACSTSEPWPQRVGHRFFERTARRMEGAILADFDLVLVASEADCGRLLEIAPAASVAVYPNSIPWAPQPCVEEGDVIAFSGNMEYHPNVTAVRHFRRRVWPLIASKVPSLRWRLIGKNEFAVRSLVADDPRIDLTGPVADAVGELARAKVVVVPLLAGSGTRVKILEAWAAGRAVVSTTIGADGLAVRNGENIRIADGPGEMAAAVLELLNDEVARKRMGEQGRKTYEAGFGWPAAWEAFEPHFHKLMSRQEVLTAS